MSISDSFKAFVTEQMAGFGPIVIRPMFGGAGVYRDGLMFALIVEDIIYLKVNDATQPYFEAENLGPYTYSMKNGKMMEMSYFRIPERCLDDADEMAVWCKKAYDAAVRAAAVKKPAVKQSAPKRLRK